MYSDRGTTRETSRILGSSFLDRGFVVAIEAAQEFLEVLLSEVPSGIFFLLVFVCLVGLATLAARKVWYRWLYVPVIAIAGVAFSLSYSGFRGRTYIARETPPYIIEITAQPRVVGKSEVSLISVRAFAPRNPKAQLLYRYRTRGVGGRVPTDWTDKYAIKYTAPQIAGDAWVDVTVRSVVARPLENSDTTLIVVVSREDAQSLNETFQAASSELAKGDYYEALKRFSEFDRRNPGSSGGSLGLGLSHAGTGNWNGALSQYAAFTDQNPGNELGYILLAQAYFKIGDQENARLTISRALPVAKDPVRHSLLRALLKTRSRTDQEMLLQNFLRLTAAPLPVSAVTTAVP
jgi:hypothetical protein